MSKFIISWCNEGLEGIVPIDNYENWDQGKTFRILTGTATLNERNPLNGIMQAMLLRATMNSSRNYEIYAIETTDGIDEDEIRDMFKNNPQIAADTIRRIGVSIFSNREIKDKVVIR